MPTNDTINKDATKKIVPAAETLKIDNVGDQRAWGGVGGSGKHAAELIPELEEYLKNPAFHEMINSSGAQRAWGGVGGSGKHAANLEPEINRQ